GRGFKSRRRLQHQASSGGILRASHGARDGARDGWGAGDPHHGAIIHSLLARSEEWLVATFDHRSSLEILAPACHRATRCRSLRLGLIAADRSGSVWYRLCARAAAWPSPVTGEP